MDIKNPNLLCRLCLGEANNPKTLFGEDEVYREVDCILQIMLMKADNWPQSICETCVRFLDQITAFKTSVENNQDLLQVQFGEAETKVVKLESTNRDNPNGEAFNSPVIVPFYEDQPEVVVKTRSKKRNREKPITKEEVRSKVKKPMIKVKVVNKSEKSVTPDERDKVIMSFMVLKCDICKEDGFEKFLDLIRHSKKVHNRNLCRIRCGTCNNVFNRRSVLYEHIMVHLDPNRYTCDECGKSFPNNRNLVCHKMIHWPENKRDFKCETCGKGFLTEGRLKIHALNHIPKTEQKFACEICEKRFPINSRLQDHILIYHKKEKFVVCEVCAKPFSTKSNLLAHMQTHHNAKQPRVQCPKCQKYFANSKSLYKHQRRVHEQAGNVKCPDCEHVAPNKAALDGHRARNHEPATVKFVCSFCDKVSKTKKTHLEHEATHTGLRLYKCKYCPLEFNSNANMYKHQKQKHKTEWEEWKRQKVEGII